MELEQMKSESKKKKDKDDGPVKKSKRQYRNDRSKKWRHGSSSEVSTDEESWSSSEEKKRKQKESKRVKSKKKSRASSSDYSVSPSPDRKKKNSKLSKRASSSEAENDRNLKKSRRKRRHSSDRDRSLSRSPSRKKGDSNRSPSIHRKKSKNRSIRERKKRSRSRTPKASRQQSKSRHDVAKIDESPRRSKSRSPRRSIKKQKTDDQKQSRSPEIRGDRKSSKSPDDTRSNKGNGMKKISNDVVAHYDEDEQDIDAEVKKNMAVTTTIAPKTPEDKESEKEEETNEEALRKEKERLEEICRQKEEKVRKLKEEEEESKRKEEKEKQRQEEKEKQRREEKERLRQEEKERQRKEEKEKQRQEEKEKQRQEEKEKQRQEEKEKQRQEEKKRKEEERKHKEKEKEEQERRRKKEREEERKEEKEQRDKEKSEDKERNRTKERETTRDREKRKEKERERDRRREDDKKIDEKKKDAIKDMSPDRKKVLVDADEEMKKRKERIEAWRNARAKKKDGTEERNKKTDHKNTNKKWSLEEDDDEEEVIEKQADMKSEEVEDEELDPLDAYMKSIDKEVNKTSASGNTKGNTSKSKTLTVVATVVKKPVEVKAKPELMEQNQDAMEYSSEEEAPADVTASDFVDVKKRKDYIVTDHTKVYYSPFRRDFYIEVPELARMTFDEVKLYRETLGDIQVRGKNIPKPIKSWAQAGLNTKVMNVLKRCGYENPTPIQTQAIPSIMSGRDMIGIAKTGSGKTLAFVLPMLRHVLDQPELEEDDGPIAVIMTPTRELALQIYRESKKFCKPLKLSIACIYGGSGISEQIAELKRGVEIIVCTPGRMIDMLAANNGKVTNCRRCTYLVLDEADRMFDMGFEPQVMRIIDNIRPDRQTVLFSATFPRQMEAVARKVLTKPIEIQVGGRSVVCSDIQQNAIVIDAENKFFKLLELLGVYQEKGSVLVFVEKQETADALFKDLLKKGYPCLSLHGGMDQFDRDSTIADFKNGVTKLMVSTSVAARGLDVKNLILVVNYDCPNHYEDYVHRVGRTGRAGNKGTAFTFVTPEQGRCCGDVVKAFELSKFEPPADVLALWNEYKEDMAKEGKKVKSNSGFTGKGFKFNQEEENQVSESKKMRKFTLGLQDSDDEAEAAENAMEKIEADLEKAFSNKPKVALAPEIVEAQKVKAAESNIDKDKLKLVDDIAAKINKKLSSGGVIDRNAAATAHILQGGALDSLKGVGLAKHFADKLNAKLNYKAVAPETTTEPEKSIAIRYEEEIDINDFPQAARWRITSKEIIEQVRELSEAGVTVRGVYVPPSKKNEDEKRLHLYIESLNERSIQIAKAEIKRLLREELIRAESHTYRPQQTGRYKVV